MSFGNEHRCNSTSSLWSISLWGSRTDHPFWTLEPRTFIGEGDCQVARIDYCPWCGYKLPKDNTTPFEEESLIDHLRRVLLPVD